jgi:hypothetical protein
MGADEFAALSAADDVALIVAPTPDAHASVIPHVVAVIIDPSATPVYVAAIADVFPPLLLLLLMLPLLLLLPPLVMLMLLLLLVLLVMTYEVVF